MSGAAHLERGTRNLGFLCCPMQKGIHASDILELAHINTALKAWLELENMCDLLLNVATLKIKWSEHAMK